MKDESIRITRRGGDGEDGYRTFSVRIRARTAAALDELARQTGRSRNELIGLLLDYGVSHAEIVG